LRSKLDQLEHLLADDFEAGIACLIGGEKRLIGLRPRVSRQNPTHQKELLKVFVPFLQNRCYLINNFTPFNYVFVFDDLNIGRSDEMNIRFWENAFQSAISIESAREKK
jgi:hypothetical protein